MKQHHMNILMCLFRIFADDINWGRILTLLCFGYRMAIQVLRDNLGKFSDFLRRIGQFLLKFLITERISRWIADHGGWVSAHMNLSFQYYLCCANRGGLVVLTLSLPKHMYRWWKWLSKTVSLSSFAGQKCSFRKRYSNAWKEWIEARGHTTSNRHAGTTFGRTSSDIVMAVRGLKHCAASWVPVLYCCP